MYFHKESCESFVSQDQELGMVIQTTGHGGTGNWAWRHRELGLMAQACDPSDWGVKGQEDQESKVTFH